jgi:hypothetical protein
MATVALVVGAAVSGGRVKGVLRDHLVSEAALARAVFPDSFAVNSLRDLIAWGCGAGDRAAARPFSGPTPLR